MQVEALDFLELALQANKVFFFDLEATGLRCDYNSVLCVSIKPNGKPVTTFSIEQPGNDQKVIRQAREMLAEAAIWVTFYGKGYDVPMLEGRLLKWGLSNLVKKHHIDLYFHLRGKINPARKSLAHIGRWLGLPEKKMDVEPDEWNNVLYKTKHTMKHVLIPRCESDATMLEAGLAKTKHLLVNITR